MKPRIKQERERERWWEGIGYLRSGLHPERSNLVVAPAHGLQGGVVVAQLSLAGQEVLTLVDGHSALPVVLYAHTQTHTVPIDYMILLPSF